MKVGHVDRCTTSSVKGWAVADGRPAELEILIDGERAATVQCDKHRKSLAGRGYPTDAGFHYRFLRQLRVDQKVAVKFLSGGELTNSPRWAAPPARHDGEVIACTTRHVTGWAVTDGRPTHVEVWCDTELLAVVPCNANTPNANASGQHGTAGFHHPFGRAPKDTQLISLRFPDGSHLKGSPRTADRYEGLLDHCSIGRVEGWALLGGKPANLEIFVNDKLVGRTISKRAHADLVNRGGRFHLVFSHLLRPTDVVSVRFADGNELGNASPKLDLRSSPDCQDLAPLTKRLCLSADDLTAGHPLPDRLYYIPKPTDEYSGYEASVFQAVAQARGFRLVNCDMSMDEQILLVQHARFIVAPGGLAVALAKFMREGSKLLVLDEAGRSLVGLPQLSDNVDADTARGVGVQTMEVEPPTALEFSVFLHDWLGGRP